MKRIVIIMSLFIFVAACSVQNDDVGVGDISVVDGKIKSPQWLVSEIDSIADTYNRSPDTGERIYSAMVYLIIHKNQKYVLIWDVLSSHSIKSKLCFTILGESVDPESSLYVDLMRETDCTLVWCPWCPW